MNFNTWGMVTALSPFAFKNVSTDESGGASSLALAYELGSPINTSTHQHVSTSTQQHINTPSYIYSFTYTLPHIYSFTNSHIDTLSHPFTSSHTPSHILSYTHFSTFHHTIRSDVISHWRFVNHTVSLANPHRSLSIRHMHFHPVSCRR